MKLWIVAVVFAVAWTGASAQVAPPTQARVIEKPKWASRATGEDIAVLFPEEMMRQKQYGSASIECQIDDNGNLRQCVTLAESIQGVGLAEAALKLATRYRMSALDEESRATSGAYIILPVSFRVPGQTGPAAIIAVKAGDDAYLVNQTLGRSVSFTNCPSPKDPKRRCYFHPLSWEASPGPAARAGYLRKIGRTEGKTRVECGADENGLLTGCRVSSDMIAPQSDPLFDMLSEFRAPKMVGSQALGSGRILIEFDWATLVAAMNRSVIMRRPTP